METLPLFFKLNQRRCLLVGGGSIALRKARLLEKAGAKISVVAKEISAPLRQLLLESQNHTQHQLFEREFEAEDVAGCVLVISATDKLAVNEQVAKACGQANIPVNVVDNPDLCTVYMPAIVDRSPLLIAISSGGSAPVLARLWRAKIESIVPEYTGRLASLARRFRAEIKKKVTSETQRRRLWETVFNGKVAQLFSFGREQEAAAAIEQVIADAENNSSDSLPGEVYLVGAGPGDPDLLTLKALQLMQQADVVLYDRLVSAPILDKVRRDAERIYVGKKRSEHQVPQPEINQLIRSLAEQGKRVLRLKGGDPFIFGRGGEELEELIGSNIPFQVVPGITAASGCASYAGIPLTHRDHSQSVRFITGHLKQDDPNIDWPELAKPNQTLVIYMGLMGLESITQALIKAGRSPSTAAALIEKGTTPEQRVFSSTLESLTATVAQEQVHAPTLLIIGEVVRLHDKLRWYNPVG